MADGVIEDADALRNVLQAWTEGAASDGCIATNAAACTTSYRCPGSDGRVSRSTTKGADMLLAACVRAGRSIQFEAAGLD